jgi:hypothetical protein
MHNFPRIEKSMSINVSAVFFNTTQLVVYSIRCLLDVMSKLEKVHRINSMVTSQHQNKLIFNYIHQKQ